LLLDADSQQARRLSLIVGWVSKAQPTIPNAAISVGYAFG